jgi:hypothetical protein
MKSISTENNDYFSFTENENGIEVIWQFNANEMTWTVLVYKDDQKEMMKLPASSAPTTEKINDYDSERLAELTLKMTDFLSKRLKLESKTPINK